MSGSPIADITSCVSTDTTARAFTKPYCEMFEPLATRPPPPGNTADSSVPVRDVALYCVSHVQCEPSSDASHP